MSAFLKEVKSEIVGKFQTHAVDTASPQVQIALLSERLRYLNEHFAKNPKDHHSRRGLLKLVGQRRRLLDYLHRTQPVAYKTLIAELGIRK